jgi:hypothetical protein
VISEGSGWLQNQVKKSIKSPSLQAHARLRPRYHQKLDGQLGALRAVGCIRVYAEKASGKDVTGRPEV